MSALDHGGEIPKFTIEHDGGGNVRIIGLEKLFINRELSCLLPSALMYEDMTKFLVEIQETKAQWSPELKETVRRGIVTRLLTYRQNGWL